VQQSQHSVINLVSVRLHNGILSTARQRRNRRSADILVRQLLARPPACPPSGATMLESEGATMK
jgi:hypothetical protein